MTPTLDRLRPAVAGDEIIVQTHVAEMKKVVWWAVPTLPVVAYTAAQRKIHSL